MKHVMPALLIVTALGAGVWWSGRAQPVQTMLPGITEQTLPARVQSELATRLAQERASGWVPRTRHLTPDGEPLYTNRLLTSASPYLRQHAHNPVNWMPWGDEAFALAEQLDRPVFLSIGYATCHWCHVMEEESFEDPEIAAFLNEHFVAIKVDRETRPDVDAIYMTAVQALTGRGGWPATLVLDPERRPFFAATYIPPRDGQRGRAKGLLTLLGELNQGWKDDRAKLDGLSAKLQNHLRERLEYAGEYPIPGPELLTNMASVASERFDPAHGGRMGAPKFPSNFPLRPLLVAAQTDPNARRMATETLDRMAASGLYDHVGGGFHRYTVDAAWQVPHFEKMLYDNAQLARLYGEAFQLTGEVRYARVVQETLGSMVQDLGARGGGFNSALDADSLNPAGEREEGWYHTWTPDEVTAVLGERAPAFLTAYGVTAEGDLDGRNVLQFATPPHKDLRADFAPDRLALELARRKRPAPFLDDKVLTSWNGLAIAALAYNGWLFKDESWVEEARSAAERILENRLAGRLQRTNSDDGATQTAFLDDYAYFIDGLLTLFEATGEARWLEEARALERVAHAEFGFPSGPWASTPTGHEALLARERPTSDGAIPSPNSVMLANLYRLAALTTDDAYRMCADALATGIPAARMPADLPDAVWALELRHQPPLEIVLVTQEGERSSGLHGAIRTVSPAHRVLVQQVEGQPAASPLAEGKVRLDAPTVYVCQGGVCDRPLTDPAAVAARLARTP